MSALESFTAIFPYESGEYVLIDRNRKALKVLSFIPPQRLDGKRMSEHKWPMAVGERLARIYIETLW